MEKKRNKKIITKKKESIFSNLIEWMLKNSSKINIVLFLLNFIISFSIYKFSRYYLFSIFNSIKNTLINFISFYITGLIIFIILHLLYKAFNEETNFKKAVKSFYILFQTYILYGLLMFGYTINNPSSPIALSYFLTILFIIFIILFGLFFLKKTYKVSIYQSFFVLTIIIMLSIFIILLLLILIISKSKINTI